MTALDVTAAVLWYIIIGLGLAVPYATLRDKRGLRESVLSPLAVFAVWPVVLLAVALVVVAQACALFLIVGQQWVDGFRKDGQP